MENERYKHKHLAQYKKAVMEDTVFEDLKLRLNYPYLFMHQDGCEHVIMVRDIR